jgi:carbon-monoxide dehydrogenase medium subunit
MHDFMLGAYTTAVAADELVVAVHLPHWAASARFGYDKICRKPGEFAEASCAARFDPAARVAAIVLGALDGAPQPLPALARAVARDGAVAGGRDTILQAVRAALPDKDEIDCGLYATAVERCLAQALDDEGRAR